jgi:lysophospholipase
MVGSRLAAAGIHTEAFDLTGFGESPGRRGHVDRLDTWLDQMDDQVARLPGDLPRVIIGHSMGGLLGLAHVLSGRPDPAALVVTAPALDADVAAWKKKLAPVLGTIAPTVPIPAGIKGEQLSRDPAVGEAYFADPLLVTSSTARLGAVLLATQKSVIARRHTLGVPTLVLHGADDTLVPATASAPLDGVRNVTREVLANIRHEPYNEPEGPEIIDRVIAWLEEVLT